MSVKKKPAAAKVATSESGLTLKLDPGDVGAIVAKQKAWAYEIAANVERGKLPTTRYEREMIATMIRHVANQWRVPESPKKRGNPAFQRKLPDDDSVALDVGLRIAHGARITAAIAEVAEELDVDESAVRKAFHKRRGAVADWFAIISNLKARAGVIRGK